MRQEWQRESLERSPCCFLRKRVRDSEVRYRSERLLGTDDENRSRDDLMMCLVRGVNHKIAPTQSYHVPVPELRTVQYAPVCTVFYGRTLQYRPTVLYLMKKMSIILVLYSTTHTQYDTIVHIRVFSCVRGRKETRIDIKASPDFTG